MINPKAQSFSTKGAKHQINDDMLMMNPEQGIYVICDGVSEGGQGKFASNAVSKTIQEMLTAANSTIRKNGAQLTGTKRLQAMQELLLSAYADAQTNLKKEAKINPLYQTASTTCISLWMDGRFGILAHIGDSRAYLYRAGKLYQLTKDHNGMNELIAAGMTQEQAMKSPMAKALSRAMGNSGYTQPELLKVEFQPNDFLVMCTDGVYSALQANGLQQLIQALSEGTQNLKEWIDRCAYQSGDDASIIQIHFPEEIYQDVPIQASERIKLIQQTPLCRHFDYIQKSHIAAICEVETFKAGSLIIQEGTDGESMYISAKGTLEVLNKGQHVCYMKPGEFFGEIALIQESKRTATVVAKEDAVLLSLSRKDLFEVFKKDLLMEKHFYRAMLETSLDRLVNLGDELSKLKSI